MKNLLLLSLLLLIVGSTNAATPDDDKVFIKCGGVLGATCPKGYETIYKEGGIYAECYCKRPMNTDELQKKKISDCETYVYGCKTYNNYYCRSAETCPLDLLIDLCPGDSSKYYDKITCFKIKKAYADKKNREGKTDDDLDKCQNYKKYCLNGNSYFCPDAVRTCDKRSLKELCDANVNGIDCNKVKQELESFEPKEEPVEELDNDQKSEPVDDLDEDEDDSDDDNQEPTPEPELSEKEVLCNKYKKSCESTLKIGDCSNVPFYCGNKVVADLCRRGFIKNAPTCTFAYNNSK